MSHEEDNCQACVQQWKTRRTPRHGAGSQRRLGTEPERGFQCCASRSRGRETAPRGGDGDDGCDPGRTTHAQRPSWARPPRKASRRHASRTNMPLPDLFVCRREPGRDTHARPTVLIGDGSARTSPGDRSRRRPARDRSIRLCDASPVPLAAGKEGERAEMLARIYSQGIVEDRGPEALRTSPRNVASDGRKTPKHPPSPAAGPRRTGPAGYAERLYPPCSRQPRAAQPMADPEQPVSPKYKQIQGLDSASA